MAPDRGSTKDRDTNSDELNTRTEPANESQNDEFVDTQEQRRQSNTQSILIDQAEQGQSFTLRGTLVGLAIGVIICFSNTYFGLQTGWLSGMAMPSALIGFAFFKSVARYIDYPFTPVENVLVTTVAGAVGTMPLGCGFVGIMPALKYLLKPEENGPLVLGTGKLIVWAIGLCFFGAVIAMPLRKQVIIRERLKFPSGTATALIIGVLHGKTEGDGEVESTDCLEIFRQRSQDILRSPSISSKPPLVPEGSGPMDNGDQLPETDRRGDWKSRIKSLLIAFAISATYVGQRLILFFGFELDTHRLSFNTLYHSYEAFPSSASLWPTTGYGHSILHLHT